MTQPTAAPTPISGRLVAGSFAHGGWADPLPGSTGLPSGARVVAGGGASYLFGPTVTALPPQAGVSLVVASPGEARYRDVAVNHTGGASPLTVRGFVMADVLAGGSDDTVVVEGAKRGVLATGAGADRVEVRAASNGGGAGNGWLVDTGAGDDALLFAGAAGRTEARVLLGDGDDAATLSGLRVAWVEAGAGDDAVALSLTGLYTVVGGAGHDTVSLDLARSALVASWRAADDALVLAARGAAATRSAALLGVETVRFADGETARVLDLLAPFLPAPPDAADDAASLDEDGSASVAVLANDARAVAGSLRILSGPANGTASVGPDGTIRYAPRADWHGADALAYAVADRWGREDTAVLSLVVRPVNDAPVARDDAGFAADAEGAATVAAAALLANDGDRDGDTLVVASVAGAVGGTATLGPDGGVRFRGEVGFVGTAAFDYTVSDGAGGTATARAFVEVATPVPPPPVEIAGTDGPDLLVGTDGRDLFLPSPNPDTLVGGLGDDRYWVADLATIVELPGGGQDRVFYYGNTSYALPEGVEDLTLARGGNRPDAGKHITALGGRLGVSGFGNEGANAILGDEGDNTLDGRGGDDTLTGGAGRDAFVLARGGGRDLVTDFDVRADHLLLAERVDLAAALADTAVGARLALADGSSLTLAGVTAAALLAAPPGGGVRMPHDPAGYRLTFADEFDAWTPFDGRSAEDGGTWRPRTQSGTGVINGYVDWHYYVHPGWKRMGLDPFEASGDGTLTVKAHWRPDLAPLMEGRQYTSGYLSSHATFAQLYGYFEARMKLPGEAGFFPAFWMLPVDRTWPPEIDIMEALTRSPDEVQFMGHHLPGVDVTRWHTYGLEWTPERLSWYVDGELVHTREGHGQHKPMYLIANLGVGGYANAPIAASGPGAEVARMGIDFIRAYESVAAPAPRATVPEGAPTVTFSVGAVAPGQAPPAADSFRYRADTSGNLVIHPDDLAFASVRPTTWVEVRVDNDRALDRYSARADNPWLAMNARVEDADGGTFLLRGFSTVDLRLGVGTDRPSDVQVWGAQGGWVTTGGGADAVRLADVARIWNAAQARETTVSVGAGNDLVEGWSQTAAGRLVADGGAGDDTILGSGRADLLAGGTGSDLLTGGEGADVFLFRAGETGADRITDFGRGGAETLRFEGGIARAGIAILDTAEGTLLDLPGDATILLVGVPRASLTEAMLVFA